MEGSISQRNGPVELCAEGGDSERNRCLPGLVKDRDAGQTVRCPGALLLAWAESGYHCLGNRVQEVLGRVSKVV